VPWLNLSGVWLSEAGFNIGDTVRVVRRSGLLLKERIEPDEEEKEQEEYKTALQEVKQTLKGSVNLSVSVGLLRVVLVLVARRRPIPKLPSELLKTFLPCQTSPPFFSCSNLSRSCCSRPP